MTVYEPGIQRVHRETLKQVSEDLNSRYSIKQIREIINDSSIESYLGYTVEHESQLLDLLVDLSKWKNEYFFLSLLDYLCDKRLFSGDIKDAEEVQERYLDLLKSDGFDFGYGRWWIAPHPEQSKFGDDRYRNSSGEIYGEDFNYDEDDNKSYITSITLVRPSSKSGEYSFYVNGAVSKTNKIRSSSKSLKEFIEIAESENQATEFNKKLFDYINYDRGNVIYKLSGCDTTRVLVRNGNRMNISEHVDVKCIDKPRHKALLTILKE